MRIYKITNIITNKIYIGKTIKSLNERLNKHFRYAYKYDTHNVLSNSIRKHGRENFIIEEIEKCNSLKQLNKREIYWIKQLNSKVPVGYNMTDGGDGLTNPSDELKTYISKRTKEAMKNPIVKKKLKESHLGQIPWNKGKTNIFSKETLRKMSESTKNLFKDKNYRKKHKIATKRGMKNSNASKKISEFGKTLIGEKNYFYGKKHSNESKEKMRIAKIGKPSWNKGKSLSKEHKEKLKMAKIGYIPSNKGKKFNKITKHYE